MSVGRAAIGRAAIGSGSGRRMQRATIGIGTGLLAIGALSGCASSEDSGSSPTPTGGSSETPTSGPTAAGGSIEGKWRGDADELLDSNTANLGSAGDIDCRGPIFITFEANGEFAQQGTATCSVGGRSVSATIATSATYTTSGNELTIKDAKNQGSVSVPTGEVAFPGSWSEGTATYEISGDTLTINFSDDTVGNVTQKYERD